jgi:hypothetical protein
LVLVSVPLRCCHVEQELEALVRRAAVQVSQEDSKDSQPSSSNAADAATGGFAGFGVAPKKGGMFALDKDVFWFAKQSKDRFRWNMLNPFPLLRQVCWTHHNVTTAAAGPL